MVNNPKTGGRVVEIFVDKTAIIDPGALIGNGTKIWHFCHIMDGVIIGDNCTLGQNVFVQRGAIIGHRCKIQNNVSIYDGVVLEEDVFIGPSAVFTNVRKPRADVHTPTENYSRTIVRRGASIGANATIVCGVEIGENALIGAGSVITKNVPPGVTVVGNPAGILVRDVNGVSFVVSFEDYYIKRKKYENRNS
jgi:UDP-2-acetamido-3-amino-2,3-dideoxy-glucuronate N-acetyltransferase